MRSGKGSIARRLVNSNRLGQLTLKLLPQTDVRSLRVVVAWMAMASLGVRGHISARCRIRAIARGSIWIHAVASARAKVAWIITPEAVKALAL